MKLICVFRGNKLLDSSTSFQDNFSKQFKQNVSDSLGFDIEELTAIKFEDEELASYVKTVLYMPNRRIEISREVVRLIKIESQPVTKTVSIDWKNCNDDKILEIFNADEIQKIQENKEYYNSLGSEKFDVGFEFFWPHYIPPKEVVANTTHNVPVVVKEITGVVLEDQEIF